MPLMLVMFEYVRPSGGAWITALMGLLVACGPAVTLESESSSDSSEGDPTSSSTSGGGPTTITTVMTSVGEVTTVGPADSSGSDTGPEFPEQCSILAQDCPRGYKCMPYANDGGGSWNDTRCSPIADDPSAVGEPCTVVDNGLSGEDDCDGTSMCWDVDPKTHEGTCAPFCIGDEANPTCPDPCDFCTISGDGGLLICLGSCDPLLQDCPRGQACYGVNDTFVCVPDVSPDDTGVGSPCEYINMCPPGLACVAAGLVPGCSDMAIGCCTPFCPIGGADQCPGLVPGSMCTPWFEEGQGPAEECLAAEVGVCLE